MRRFPLAGLLVFMALQGAPEIQTFTLPNGLRVHLLEDHATPLVPIAEKWWVIRERRR